MKCQKCNTENQEGARFCEKCGNVLNTPKITNRSTENLNFCPDCGKPIEVQAEFCANCGSAIGGQCPQCGALNKADAKFCEKCAQPLNWVCPVCNNKNLAGAVFCASCGSDSIIRKPFYKKPLYIGIAATVLIMFSVLGFNFFSEPDYVPSSSHSSSSSAVSSSSNSGSSTDSGSNSRPKQKTVRYKTSATLRFEVYDNVSCLTKSNLSVTALGSNSVFDVDSYYHTAMISEGSSGSGVRGNYRFSWSLVNDCGMSTPSQYDYKTYSGTFSIDGLHSDYRIKIYGGSYGRIEVVSND
jgi:hypothetical protein